MYLCTPTFGFIRRYSRPIKNRRIVAKTRQVCARVCSLKLWSVTDGTHIQTIGHAGHITCVAFSRDSLYVVTGSEDMSLKVWEAATGKLTQVVADFGRRKIEYYLCHKLS